MKKINFPDYFIENTNFKSLNLDEGTFVDYTHNLDTITDVQLNIKENFLLFVLEGQVKLVAPDGETFVDNNQSALIIKNGYIMSETLSEDDKQFKALLFFLSDGLINEFIKLKNIQCNLNNNADRFVQPISVTAPLKTYVHSIIQILSQEIGTDEYLNKIKAQELLHYIYSDETSRSIFDQLACKPENDEVLLKKVVKSGVAEKLSLDQMAFTCNMSISNFKRKFEKHFGTSPGKWIKEKKMALAYDLITSTNEPIQEISYKCGFNSTSYFIQTFKAKFGESPAKLRG